MLGRVPFLNSSCFVRQHFLKGCGCPGIRPLKRHHSLLAGPVRVPARSEVRLTKRFWLHQKLSASSSEAHSPIKRRHNEFESDEPVEFTLNLQTELERKAKHGKWMNVLGILQQTARGNMRPLVLANRHASDCVLLCANVLTKKRSPDLSVFCKLLLEHQVMPMNAFWEVSKIFLRYEPREAVQFLDDVFNQNEVFPVPASDGLYQSMISALEKLGELQDQLKLLDIMLKVGVNPPVKTYEVLLQSCDRKKASDSALAVIEIMEKVRDRSAPKECLQLALDTCIKCDEHENIISICKKMATVGIYKHSIAINSFLKLGRVDEAIQAFEHSLSQGFPLNFAIFARAVRQLLEHDRPQRAEQLLHLVVAGHRYSSHVYGVAIDLLKEGWSMKKACDFVRAMPSFACDIRLKHLETLLGLPPEFQDWNKNDKLAAVSKILSDNVPDRMLLFAAMRVLNYHKLEMDAFQLVLSSLHPPKAQIPDAVCALETDVSLYSEAIAHFMGKSEESKIIDILRKHYPENISPVIFYAKLLGHKYSGHAHEMVQMLSNHTVYGIQNLETTHLNATLSVVNYAKIVRATLWSQIQRILAGQIEYDALSLCLLGELLKKQKDKESLLQLCIRLCGRASDATSPQDIQQVAPAQLLFSGLALALSEDDCDKTHTILDVLMLSMSAPHPDEFKQCVELFLRKGRPEDSLSTFSKLISRGLQYDVCTVELCLEQAELHRKFDAICKFWDMNGSLISKFINSIALTSVMRSYLSLKSPVRAVQVFEDNCFTSLCTDAPSADVWSEYVHALRACANTLEDVRGAVLSTLKVVLSRRKEEAFSTACIFAADGCFVAGEVELAKDLVADMTGQMPFGKRRGPFVRRLTDKIFQQTVDALLRLGFQQKALEAVSQFVESCSLSKDRNFGDSRTAIEWALQFCAEKNSWTEFSSIVKYVHGWIRANHNHEVGTPLSSLLTFARSLDCALGMCCYHFGLQYNASLNEIIEHAQRCEPKHSPALIGTLADRCVQTHTDERKHMDASAGQLLDAALRQHDQNIFASGTLIARCVDACVRTHEWIAVERLLEFSGRIQVNKEESDAGVPNKITLAVLLACSHTHNALGAVQMLDVCEAHHIPISQPILTGLVHMCVVMRQMHDDASSKALADDLLQRVGALAEESVVELLTKTKAEADIVTDIHGGIPLVQGHQEQHRLLKPDSGHSEQQKQEQR